MAEQMWEARFDPGTLQTLEQLQKLTPGAELEDPLSTAGDGPKTKKIPTLQRLPQSPTAV